MRKVQSTVEKQNETWYWRIWRNTRQAPYYVILASGTAKDLPGAISAMRQAAAKLHVILAD